MVSKKRKTSKRKAIYSINFFYYYQAYDSTFLNWYYNNFGSHLLHPQNLKQALLFTLNKVVEYVGIETKWSETIQYNEAKYFVYYRIYKYKGKYSDKKRDATRKGMPLFLRVDLGDWNDVLLRARELHLTTQLKKKFKKQIKSKKPINDYEIFKFFVRALTKRYKFRRMPKSIKVEDYKYYKL